MKLPAKDSLAIAGLCAMLGLAAIFFRPAIPIDETRYLSVAWEMFLNHNYFLPTLNFEPYHHKPPLLFWLINLFWEILGVHRWAAVMAVVIVSSSVVFLLRRFARSLFTHEEDVSQRLPWILIATAPFLFYGTVIMFDWLLTLCIVIAWICAAGFLKSGRLIFAIPTGFFLGLGVLAKGPVVLLYTLLPLLLAPLWHKNLPPKKKYYGGLALAFIIGLGPVLFWLIPVYHGTSKEFFEWLLVRQTTGRIRGDFGGAHSQPVYFYIPYFLALFTPWLLLPAFWKGLKQARQNWKENEILRFCLFAIVPAFVIFTLMSGKQPHYLVPMTIFAAILTAKLLENVSLKTIKMISAAMVTALVIGQGVASKTILPNYDLSKIAEIVAAHPDRDWAYVRNYHGEVTFLARREKTITGLEDIGKLPQWFAAHPGGMAIVRHRHPDDLKPYKILYSQDYSSEKTLSVIEQNPEYP